MTPLQFEKLISLYGNSIYGFCYHLTGSIEKAEDLYQETMLKALEIRDRINCNSESEEDIYKLRNYCIGIAVRLYRNIVRKENRNMQNVSIDDESNYHQYESQSSPERESIKREMIECLKECIDILPLKKRAVVYMFYYLDMSIDDISKILKVPKGTIKSRLNSARNDIRKEMEEKGYDGIG